MKVYVTATMIVLAIALGGNVAWAADDAGSEDASGRKQPGCPLAGSNEPSCCAAGQYEDCSRTDGSCDCGSDSCCCHQRRRGLVAGVEATYLKANIRDEGTLLTQGCDQLDSGRLANFTDLTGSPRIWIGFETDRGWGLRGRYWEYTAAKSNDDFFVFDYPNIVETVSANSRLHIYAVDAEVTRRFRCGDWRWLGSFGLRNTGLKVNHGFDFFQANALDEEYVIVGSATTNSLRQVDATGLTGSFEARRPFGDRGLAFAWNMRGSVLWGTDTAVASSRFMFPDVTLAQLAAVQESTTQYIFETQLGLEWSRHIECLKGCAFAHLMFEYQRWTADLRHASFEMCQTVNDNSLSLRSIEPNIDFAGVAFAIGFTR